MSGGQRPRISVCIANYNGERMLQDCIDSVMAQDVDADIEIIVHDDASTDGSVVLLEAKYPQAKILPSSENVGFCISNNRMADAATGDYLLLLNNDAALAPDALTTLLDEQLRIGGPCILSLPQRDWETGMLVDHGCLLDPFYNPVPNVAPSRQDVAYVIGACLWCPRETWHSLGGFPAWMESIGEDLYLCCLARLRGMPVRVARASRYRHRQGASFGGNRADGGLHTSFRRRRLSERNKTAAMLICTPTPLVWPLLAVHLSALAIEGGLLSLARRDGGAWRQIYAPLFAWIAQEFAGLRQRRHAIQQTRNISLLAYARDFTWVPRKLAMLLRHGMPRLY